MNCSIVIPVFNLSAKTERCLDALARTARGAEVIVVDNGSSDGTRDMLSRRVSKAKPPLTKALFLGENRNFAGGCNAGLKEATRGNVIFLNNDTIPEPGWAAAMEQVLDDDPGVGVVGALLWYPGKPRRVQHAGMAFTAERAAYHLYRGMVVDDAPGILNPKDLQCVTGACLAMRRADALKLGGFDEGYRNGWEDVDLCFRVRFDLGLRVFYEPRAQLVHEEGQTPGRFLRDAENAVRFATRWGEKVKPDGADIIRRIDGGVRFQCA